MTQSWNWTVCNFQKEIPAFQLKETEKRSNETEKKRNILPPKTQLLHRANFISQSQKIIPYISLFFGLQILPSNTQTTPFLPILALHRSQLALLRPPAFIWAASIGRPHTNHPGQQQMLLTLGKPFLRELQQEASWFHPRSFCKIRRNLSQTLQLQQEFSISPPLTAASLGEPGKPSASTLQASQPARTLRYPHVFPSDAPPQGPNLPRFYLPSSK